MTLDDILGEIKKADSILILSHEGPDGDAIGSSLAMYLAIKDMGRNVEVVIKEIPENFSFLPCIDEVKPEPSLENYDLAIALDCPDLNRINSSYIPYFENAKITAQFDHHNKNSMFADYNIVNHVSPACAQILVSNFDYLGIETTKDIATCLLAGIITDTGGFKNSGITVETFEFAGWALDKGVNVSKVYKDSMLIVTKSKFEIQKLAMDRLEFLENGKIAFTYLTKEDEKAICTNPGDRDGVVEIGRNIEGVEVSIFVYEKDKGFKASLRSNEYVNVSEICIYFGGGGHIKAAGADINMPLEEVKKAILAETVKYLK